MKTLRAYRNVWRFARFEPASGSFRKLPLVRTLGWRDVTGDGWYDELGRQRLCLYVDHGALYLNATDVTMPFDAQTEATVEVRNGRRVLQVRRGAQTIRAEYKTPRTLIPLDRDFTPFVEMEHFDFGLFLCNLAQDPARIQRIIAAVLAAELATPGTLPTD